MRFQGATAVVTGGGSGIGAALARELAQRGATPVIADRDLDRALSVARGAGGTAEHVDVSDPGSMADLADRHPDATLVFLNAGVVGSAVGAPWEVPAGEWDSVFATNVGGVVNGLRAFVPALLRRGAQAHVVITASLAGAAVFPGGGAYGPSKHAVLAVARHAAMALAGTPVSVHVLCPAFVRTAMSTEGITPEEAAGHAVALIEADRFAWVPDEWHEAVVNGGRDLVSGARPSPPGPS
ncbi:SDR family NAD(P)-dependent oxidoreductase [Actinokineospora pegani]|uniref:SDR family NAD(P)-dependent oxidoreductase n=1 Tax=Actinokineospora pegani TaxID=2654637 RepID=UPI0012E9E294|nr:SDR family NAD(P)-dependent oxidoreductase [Actinokineospora pegani]